MFVGEPRSDVETRTRDLGPLSSVPGTSERDHVARTHGYERMVERRIRLWVVQQERNRRRARAGRGKAAGGAPGEPVRRALDLRRP
jgi:hypothetical protein